MGTVMSVDVRPPAPSPEAVADALEQAFALLAADDRRFSTYRADSEVSRLNAGLGDLADASPELREVLALGHRLEASSGGAFTCRDPAGLLDPSGVVKGWSGQRAADLLLGRGVRNFCLNAGGDVVAHGGPEPGRDWHVGVRSPSDPSIPLAVLAVRDQAVATSGGYERGGHLWDGRSGEPARGLASVTVVAPDLTTADMLATAVYALGPDGVAWAAESFAVDVLALTESGELLTGGDVRSLLARSGPRA
ncbi:MAG: hypothetical protein JWP61_1313 [Friedmanniella sp.]|nr:hypothetical protein [Friedmanniella sp.]